MAFGFFRNRSNATNVILTREEFEELQEKVHKAYAEGSVHGWEGKKRGLDIRVDEDGSVLYGVKGHGAFAPVWRATFYGFTMLFPLSDEEKKQQNNNGKGKQNKKQQPEPPPVLDDYFIS